MPQRRRDSIGLELCSKCELEEVVGVQVEGRVRDESFVSYGNRTRRDAKLPEHVA